MPVAQGGVSSAAAVERSAGGSRALGRYAPGLDGLRTVAVLGVLLYHSEFSWARGGFLGISQFFTLSGFLITSILLRSRSSGRLDVRGFWGNRYRRLMPAAFVTLAGVVLFGATVATEQQLDQIPGGVTAALGQVANWYFVFSNRSYVELFSAPSPVQHFWSLAVEEQFYLLMPAGLYLLMRRNRSLRAAAAILAGAALALTAWTAVLFQQGASIDRLYYGTDTRIPEILLGCVLAVVLHARPLRPTAAQRRLLSAAGVAALAVTVWAWVNVSITDRALYRGGFLVFSLVSLALILALLTDTGPAAALLRSRPFAATGRITYGIYLFHWPVFLWLTADRTGLDPAPLLALRTALTLTIATASYHLIEMPIREQRLRLVVGRLKWIAAPAAACIATGAVLAAQRDVQTNLAGLGEEVSAAPTATHDDPTLDILAITDPTGQQIIDQLQTRADNSDDLTLTVAQPLTCQALTTGRTPTCANWADEWPTLIKNQDPDVILFHATSWDRQNLTDLSGLTDPEQLTTWTHNLLDNGLDLLTTNHATVVWNQSPEELGDVAAAVQRQSDPFFVAMQAVTDERNDVRRRRFFWDDVDKILDDLDLYRRRDAQDLPHVLIVGDSVSRTFGYGLEHWANQQHTALVWSAGTEGCGIANEGVVVDDTGRRQSVPRFCRELPDTWAGQIAEFDPDLVIVMSTLADLKQRQLEDWPDPLGPGDGAFDDYLTDEYVDAYDTLTAGGAHIVWATAPCMPPRAGVFRDAEGGWSGKPERIARHNEVILPRVADARPDLRIFDIDSILCPDGKALETIGGIDDFRPDGVHFSPEASIWLAENHGQEILDLGLR